MKNKDVIAILSENPEAECCIFDSGGFLVQIKRSFIRNEKYRTIIQADYDR